MPPQREAQRAIEAQMARMLETAMPAIQEEINNEVERYQAAIQAWNEQHDRVPRTRMYIHRDREQAGLRLFMDYFSADPRWSDQMFRRRFRMRRNVFLRIVNAVVARDAYFMQTFDAVGRQSISTLQKCTSALRQLAYGTAADMFDEYLHVSEHTGRACLAKFCRAVIEAFKDTYLRKQRPTMFADWCECTRRGTASRGCWAASTVCTGRGRIVQWLGEEHSLASTKAHIQRLCWRPLPTNGCGSGMPTLESLGRTTTSMC